MRINDCTIPKSLEKSPTLNMYDSIGDLDDHLDSFELMQQYRGAKKAVKCRIFLLTLYKADLDWFRGLRLNSTSSWPQLARLISARFTTSRLKPKSEDMLKAIRQGETETLGEYVKRFNMEAVNVRDQSDKMMLYFMKDGL